MAKLDHAYDEFLGTVAVTAAEIVMRAGEHRKRARQYRALAADYRSLVAADRKSAAQDREQAERDRLLAVADRDALAHQVPPVPAEAGRIARGLAAWAGLVGGGPD
ncbi:MAG: hypothetical protein QOD69_1343 [Solirubrobacteraceae bacterium]|nr:hypothetical protein [Solirubrobacteraceae bacterium]